MLKDLAHIHTHIEIEWFDIYIYNAHRFSISIFYNRDLYQNVHKITEVINNIIFKSLRKVLKN